MENIEKIKVSQNITIKDALKIIDQGNLQIILITDENDTLLSVVTDGDIRRGLLNGLNLDNHISEISNSTPIVIKEGYTNTEVTNLAIKNKLYQIPIVNEKNQVIGIEDLALLLKKKEHLDTSVVIMAGGLGTRLRPLTNDTPKPMLPVGEKPILENILNHFINHGFRTFFISVNYLSNKIEDYFGNGDKFGVNIQYLYEDEFLGTAGALSLLPSIHPYTFIINGDILSGINLTSMLNEHKLNHSDATMAIKEYTYQIPYGVVTSENNTIISMEEKPQYMHTINTGIYLISKNTLESIPKNTKIDMPDFFTFLLNQNKKCRVYKTNDYWLDIGHHDDYKKANLEFKELTIV
jgi:dTDP-glucose pyrophosphorylase